MDSRIVNRLRRARGLWALVRDRPDATSLGEIIAAVDWVMANPSISGHQAIAELLAGLLRELRAAAAGSPYDRTIIEVAMEAIATHVGRRSDNAALTTGQAPLFGRTVYVAVSDSDLADSLCPQIELFQYAVVRIGSPEELVSRGAVERPSVIVVDADFGGFDAGLAACHALHQRLGEYVPSIVLSGRDDFRTRLNVVRVGGVRLHASRPEPITIVEEIRRILQRDAQPAIRALVVDDSSVNAYRVQVDLEAAGMVVRALTSPETLIEEMSVFRPEILLLDLYQPTASGVEIAKMIRMDDRFISTPIVFISNETDPDRQAYVMASGDEFVEKPYHTNRLVQTVRNRVMRAREIKRLMSCDSMTGLLDHRHVMQCLDDELDEARRSGRPCCFVMIDIDHFKSVNDTHGHAVGDVVINSLALLLKQRLRSEDGIGRYGGEEFALILPDTAAPQAVKLVDDLRQRFASIKHHGANGVTFACTLSAGLALHAGQSAEALASEADEALYQAKRGGRNQVVLSENTNPAGVGGLTG